MFCFSSFVSKDIHIIKLYCNHKISQISFGYNAHGLWPIDYSDEAYDDWTIGISNLVHDDGEPTLIYHLRHSEGPEVIGRCVDAVYMTLLCRTVRSTIKFDRYDEITGNIYRCFLRSIANEVRLTSIMNTTDVIVDMISCIGLSYIQLPLYKYKVIALDEHGYL